MNKVFMMGRLTADPEVRYTNGEKATAVARYTLAVNRKIKREGEPEADFFVCTCFGKLAEFAEKYLTKGTKLIVTGRIENDNYTNRDGQKVYGTKIMIEEQEFAESKGSTESKPKEEEPSGEGFMNIPDGLDEELPFA